MEEQYKAKRDAEAEAKRAAYEAEVAAAKLATVSQLVKGEVVVRPPAGRNKLPGELDSRCNRPVLAVLIMTHMYEGQSLKMLSKPLCLVSMGTWHAIFDTFGPSYLHALNSGPSTISRPAMVW